MSADAHTLIQRGHAERREQRLDDALLTFAEAVAAARRDGNDADLVHALKGLGQIERDAGRGQRALPLYEEAAELCLANDDLHGLAHALRHLGDIHQDADGWSAAESYYQQALNLYRRLPDVSVLDLANALRPYALLRERLGDVEAATPLWREARMHYLSAGIAAAVEECDLHLP
jgi:tetratricopeptide (TPR) repeat protein